jgi:hypothetical protein
LLPSLLNVKGENRSALGGKRRVLVEVNAILVLLDAFFLKVFPKFFNVFVRAPAA